MDNSKHSLEHAYSEGCVGKCGECIECGLSTCTVCGECEGSLTTHCPGSKEVAKMHDAYAEPWDFRNGEWVPGIWSRRRTWGSMFAIYNELRYLEYLQGDAAGNQNKTLEVVDYLKKQFCSEFAESLG